MKNASFQKIIPKIKKYRNFLFNQKSFSSKAAAREISKHALDVANVIRGEFRKPTIIIHGIMKRSGTVYVGELLHRHPDVSYYPNNIWEIPFLTQTDKIISLQQDFYIEFSPNISKIAEHDFLPIFGSAFLSYLFAYIPQYQRMLLKMPGVQYLQDFYNVFPFEHLLLLVRDGRDVVTSMIKTWPQYRFVDVCRRWDRSAKMITAFHKQFDGKQGYCLFKFEDAVKNPADFVRKACLIYGLDPDRYPYDEIENIPVIGSSTTSKKWGGHSGWIKKPAGFKPVGRWQGWSKWRKGQFKRIAGQSLIDLGYAQDFDW